jgi:hypothetical protein
MGAKAKIARAASAVAQVALLGPVAAFTVPATDAALSHAESKWDEKKQRERDRKN